MMRRSILCLLLAACGSSKVMAPPGSSITVTVDPAGTGAIRGKVVDAASGEPLLLVTVVARGAGTTRSELTDDQGQYDIGELPPGVYELLFIYGDTRQSKRVSVGAHGDVIADARLEASSAGETITVEEKAPTIDSSSTKRGVTIQQDYLQNTPTRGRTWEDALAAPGPGEPAADELWIIARDRRTMTSGAAPKLGSGQLRVVGNPDAVEPVLLPLERTDVRAKILGYIASVEVVQRFSNPYGEKIEVEYVFPLPENAAVADFVMVIGDRRIRGVVRDRAEAEQIYAEARDAGHVASLMTEERPNIFVQRVANLEPRKAIDIELTYFNTLPYGDGAYSFVFPMVVGPRYKPAQEVSYLRPEQRSRHRTSITVELDAGTPLGRVDSPTHMVDVASTGPRSRRITLATGEVTPDRDFVLRWTVAGKSVQPAFFHDGETFTVMLAPPAELGELRRAPMEMVFVLDCSGSMSGTPLDIAKRTVARALDRLGPEDTLQIITFSQSASALGPAPVPATRANLARARRWLDSLVAEGGTEMITGIRAALAYPDDPQRLRLVTFLTDGYIGNEAEILAEVERLVGRSRIFSFGVGSSVNRYLLEKLATFGRGAAAFVGMGGRADDLAAVDAFYERVSHPALADVTVDWNGMQVSDVNPRRIPDLVVGRPVTLTGKLRGPVAPWIVVRGRAGDRVLEQRVPIERVTPHPALAKVWARARLGALGDRAIVAQDREPILRSVKETALKHGLLSAYTAFVAVDAATQTAPGAPTRVPQAVPVPAGVSYETTVSPR